MQVVTASEMMRIEGLAYAAGEDEELFMENAGRGIAVRAMEMFAHEGIYPKKIILLCGKGNNAGDAFVAGRYLIDRGLNASALELCTDPNDYSPLVRKNRLRFLEVEGKCTPYQINKPINFNGAKFIIDGLLGTGIKGEVRSPYKEVIEEVNRSKISVLSIDIPSGLCPTTGNVLGGAILAKETIFLGLPKRGFFLRKGWERIGFLNYIDFGLKEKYTKQLEGEWSLHYQRGDFPKLPQILHARHKYQAGYVCIVGGSCNMPGAPLMAGEAAMQSGSGMVKIFYPEGADLVAEKASMPLICQPFNQKNLESLVGALNKAHIAVIGMGMGKSVKTSRFLHSLLKKLTIPLLLDADGLNLLAENQEFPFPDQCLITPHLGEMARLLNEDTPQEVEEPFLERCQGFANEKNVIILLKTYCYFLFTPKRKYLELILGGDPGLAKAGSGDILSGLIGSLAAQGLTLRDAALLGAGIQADAGSLAAKQKTSYCMTALDQLEHFPEVFTNYVAKH